MSDDISKALDECLARLRKGETAEQCLADYPDLRSRLEPLLGTALAVSSLPEISPSSEFRQKSPGRLVARLRNESRGSKRGRRMPGLSGLRRVLLARPLAPIGVAIAATIAVMLLVPLLTSRPTDSQAYSLSLLKGSAEVKRAGATDWERGADGVRLAAGSQVRTGADSYVLLTFFDGSTTKLEPGTEVTVSQSDYIEQRLVRIELEQKSGGTWSHVQTWDQEVPYFAVQTPQLKVVAQGTSFGTEVEESGRTRLSVSEGSVEVIEEGKSTRLAANQRFEAEAGAAPQDATRAPTARNELVVSTGLPGVGSVRDPSGASTGYLPEGLALNQITDSKAALYPDGQQITVDEPKPGEYAITVRSVSNDVIPVNIQIRSEGNLVFERNDTFQGAAGQVWVTRIRLDTDKGARPQVEVSSAGPLAGKPPETVVKTDLARRRALPIRPADPIIKTPGSTPNPTTTPKATPSPTRIPATPKPTGTARTPTPPRPGLTPLATVQPRPSPTPTMVLTPIPARPTPTPLPTRESKPTAAPGTVLTPPPGVTPKPTAAMDTVVTPAARATPTPTPLPTKPSPAVAPVLTPAVDTVATPAARATPTPTPTPLPPKPSPTAIPISDIAPVDTGPAPTPTPTALRVEPKPTTSVGTTTEAVAK